MKKIMFNDKYGLTEAVLEGRKTQTRRIVKLNEGEYVTKLTLPMGGKYLYIAKDRNPISCVCGYECPNYVRPLSQRFISHEEVAVAQSYQEVFDTVGTMNVPQLQEIPLNHKGWHNKMFVSADIMPHRIMITNIRVECLQDISDEDCMKEGIMRGEFINIWDEYYFEHGCNNITAKTARDAFKKLINKVSGKGTWESNPYVFVYDFKLIK